MNGIVAEFVRRAPDKVDRPPEGQERLSGPIEMILRNFMNIGVALAISFSFSAEVFACSRRTDVPDASYLEYAESPVFASVGAIYVIYDDQTYIRASGVLIHQSWVLTPAHVVEGIDGYGQGISEVRFYTGHDLLAYTHQIQVDDFLFHPNYVPNVDEEYNSLNWDVALLHLSQPITDIVPAVRFRGTDVRGTQIEWAGYGMFGTGNYGVAPDNWDYNRRGWSNVAEWFGGDQPAYYAGSHYWVSYFDTPSYGALPLEGSTTNGTSGAGGFAFIGGQWRLVGLNTFVWAAGNYFYGAHSGASRISLLNSWIDTIVPPSDMDCDADGDVDMDDYADFADCFSGPGAPVDAVCECFDFNYDTAVDMLDFAAFQRAFGQ